MRSHPGTTGQPTVRGLYENDLTPLGDCRWAGPAVLRAQTRRHAAQCYGVWLFYTGGLRGTSGGLNNLGA